MRGLTLLDSEFLTPPGLYANTESPKCSKVGHLEGDQAMRVELSQLAIETLVRLEKCIRLLLVI